MIDQSNSIDGFRDGQNADPARPDYSYDLNGNMTQDWNKGISEITYNHLNLPTRIIFNYDVNKKIDYLYNALGVKLKKVVDDKTVIPNVYQETHYLGGFQYVGDYLQFFPTAEGYVSVKESNYNYVYNYTDHLGNIRLSYTREGSVTKVLEENHYYPFGMKHSYNADIREWGLDRETGEVYAIVEEVDRSNYQYKYNGKEYQDELSLNWYDYQARNYDPAIGRWMNIDPKAEKYFQLSPYVYVANNPLIYIDPDGKDLILAGDKKIVDRTIAVANQGIGKSIVKVDKNGNVTMKSLSDKQLSKMSSEQKAMYGVMKDVIGKEGEVVKIGVESGSKDVLIGSYALEKIDIADIEAFGTGKAVNQASTLGHELKEQKEKQINGDSYADAHADGKAAENSISGFTRQAGAVSTTNVKGNSDGTISGNIDVEYTKGTETVKTSITIENNNVIKVTR